MLLRILSTIAGFCLFTACTAPASPLPTPVLFPSATAQTSTNAPFVTSQAISTAPVPSLTASETATRRPALTATSTPRASLPRTPTPTSPKVSWEVRTLLVGPGKPGRSYALLGTPFNSTIPEQMRLVFSDDEGATWSAFPAGLPAGSPCLHNVNLDYARPDALYASTCGGLERLIGNNWTRISAQETWAMAVVYKQPNLVWAISTRDKGGVVIRSRDAGSTWTPADSGLINFSGVANLAIDPRDANTLYAIINPQYAGSYLRRGNASGQWQTMHTPLNDSVIETGMTIDGASGALYVTTADYGTIAQGHWQIWRSPNPSVPDINTVKWELVHDFGASPRAVLLASGTRSQGLALYAQFFPPDGEPYLQRSLDGGKTWATIAIP